MTTKVHNNRLYKVMKLLTIVGTAAMFLVGGPTRYARDDVSTYEVKRLRRGVYVPPSIRRA